MFEVGQHYRISTGVGEEIGHGVFRVLEVEGPLVKIECMSVITIINTHAPSFHSAELQETMAHDAIVVDDESRKFRQ